MNSVYVRKKGKYAEHLETINKSNWLSESRESSHMQFLPPAYVRTTGGYVFTGVCLFNFRGGRGTPSQVWVRGGTPSQVWVGGYPISGLGRGVPHPRSRSGGVTTSQVWGGTPFQVRGRYPIPGPGGYSGYPPPRNSKHLLRLRGGRYASCVHAGGLSCFLYEYVFHATRLNISFSYQFLVNHHSHYLLF